MLNLRLVCPNDNFIIMAYQKRTLLNRLHRLLPEGLLADAAWFTSAGYPSSLRSRYVASGWLQPVTRGVFRRPLHKPGFEATAAPLRWQHVVISLQLVLERPIVVGGRTALELDGFGHYTSSAGPREIHLYGDESAPGWLGKLPTKPPFVFHNARKLFRTEPISRGLEGIKSVMASDVPSHPATIHGSLTWMYFGDGDWPIVLSTRERAILELLDELPDKETFHQADVLMEGLVNLSPRRMSRCLRECRSVKVKRLFLWLAERHRHAWLERLDRTGIDLGRGKRMLVRGGRLDPTYQITVPEDLDAGG